MHVAIHSNHCRCILFKKNCGCCSATLGDRKKSVRAAIFTSGQTKHLYTRRCTPSVAASDSQMWLRFLHGRGTKISWSFVRRGIQAQSLPRGPGEINNWRWLKSGRSKAQINSGRCR